MFNEFSHLDFISIVAADPTLPLAPAPALLDVEASKKPRKGH